MANVLDPQFDDALERSGFSYRRARIGRQAGAEKLGVSLYEIPPGNASFPYHWHGANEELAIVLSGHPSVRTPDGWRELTEGDLLSFPTGDGSLAASFRLADEVDYWEGEEPPG
jgi:uncharacterized cupin superfamily protein